jgi:dimethylargininase
MAEAVMQRALVRRPGPRLADGLVTHIAKSPIDMALATKQWQDYVDALDKHGWTPIEVPPADECADAVFIEDAVVMFGRVAVITNPGAPSRKPETAAVEEVVRGLGYDVQRIAEPGTLDGGDVLKVGKRAYVGVGGRTNDAGFQQLKAVAAPLGYDVIAVPTTKVLHLKSAVTALPDGTIIGYRPAIDDETVFGSVLPIPEEPGAHVVVLSDTKVLMAAGAPKAAKLFGARGFKAITVDISEYQKLEGCVTCLSVRLR